jgi:hypothetical protein
MQSGIDGNSAETRSPAGEHQFQELGAVLHAQDHTVAGLEAASGETGCEAGDAAGEFAITPGVKTVANRRRLRLPAGTSNSSAARFTAIPA